MSVKYFFNFFSFSI